MKEQLGPNDFPPSLLLIHFRWLVRAECRIGNE